MTTTAQTSAKKSGGKNKSAAMAKTSKETAVAVNDYDYGDEYDQGYDPSAAEDMLIPRLIVLQTNSLQVLPVQDGGVENAKAGQLFNTVTQELMEACTFVPAYSEKCYNEWIDKDEGGGFVARHELEDSFVIAKRKETPRGKIEFEGGDGKKHQLAETVYLYLVPVDAEGNPLDGFCVLDFTSTKLAVWRTWITKIRSFTVKTDNGKRRPPMYAHRATLTTTSQKNDKGRWYVPSLGPAKKCPKTKLPDLNASLIPMSAPAFEAAKQLAEMVHKGEAKAQQATEQHEGAAAAAGGDQAKGKF